LGWSAIANCDFAAGFGSSFDYCRGKWKVSLLGSSRLWIKAAVLFAPAAFVLSISVPAQYPGQIAKPETDAPEMRAVAVFEWTGDEAHPKAARLVPVCIYDGQELNDAGIYLTHPEPLALESDVEYQLQKDGNPVGLFDIDTSAREQGGWVGYGKWRALPKAKAAPTQVAKIDAEDDAQSDVPILHRKHADDSAGSGGGSSSGSESSGTSGSAPDPDRPTLHKGGDTSTTNSDGASSGGSSSGGTSSDGSSQANSGSGSGSNSGGDSNAPPSDPDRPVVHRTDDSSAKGDGAGNGSGGGSGGDSSRPKLKKKSKDADVGYVENVASAADPNRPHLSYGKFGGYGAPVVPTLFGLPPDMQQTVAVSDAIEHPEHTWNYVWANPGDEDKMQSAMEDAARSALGLNPPPAPKRTPRTAGTHATAKPAGPTSAPASAAAPAPLLVEKFRVFELAYGSGATMVLSAHTADAGAQEKFVTLIAQPDLYGGVNVLVKNVTDAAHLDDTPRMRLVDAVEAEKDNRGELLFELRGTTERQFALFRVLRGDATRVFLSGPESIAAAIAN
jgi:hypothetical protein